MSVIFDHLSNLSTFSPNSNVTSSVQGTIISQVVSLYPFLSFVYSLLHCQHNLLAILIWHVAHNKSTKPLWYLPIAPMVRRDIPRMDCRASLDPAPVCLSFHLHLAPSVSFDHIL